MTAGAFGVLFGGLFIPAVLAVGGMLIANPNVAPRQPDAAAKAAAFALFLAAASAAGPARCVYSLFKQAAALTGPDPEAVRRGVCEVRNRLRTRGIVPLLVRELPLPVRLAVFLPDLSPLRSRLLALWLAGHFLLLAGVLLLLPSPLRLWTAGHHRAVPFLVFAQVMFDVAATAFLFLALAAYRRDWRAALSLWRYRLAVYACLPAAAFATGRVLLA